MANMSYCRFQNTARDLRDCFIHLDEAKSPEEKKARLEIITLCKQILAEADFLGLIDCEDD